MNEITRYRLIGSIFLLSLAAIFVPMVFDAPAPERDSDFLIDQEEETAAAAQNDDSQWLAPQQEVDELIAELKQREGDLDAALTESRVQEQVSALTEQVDADGYWSENGTRFGEPILSPVRSDTTVFAVQLATFDDPDNAKSLRQQLRDDDQEAFISQYKQRGLGGEKIRYRVAVGPLLSHTLAKEKRASYTQTYGVQAIVVAMSQ
ncbi:MAG: SPOR domain-containing protein [Pseudomonadales bacterium]|jgi:cell division septation protein DedD|nr:SPOR domain-containing protein [Pseudomonadales bacterium]